MEPRSIGQFRDFVQHKQRHTRSSNSSKIEAFVVNLKPSAPCSGGGLITHHHPLPGGLKWLFRMLTRQSHFVFVCASSKLTLWLVSIGGQFSSLQVSGLPAHQKNFLTTRHHRRATSTLVRYMTSLLTPTVSRLTTNHAQTIGDQYTLKSALFPLRQPFKPRSWRSPRIGVPLSPLASHSRTPVPGHAHC